MLKNFFASLVENAEKQYRSNIFKFLEPNPGAVFLDCGCDNGEFTVKMAERIKSSKVFGIEIVDDKIAEARKKGIDTLNSDLNKPFPLPNESIDVVVSNQVIEHLYDTDNFLSQIFRVLRKGGYAMICTENLSSWHNIFAILFGWQPFSLSNISSKRLGIGNPLALHRGEEDFIDTWQHIKVFSFRGWIELFEAHGFYVEGVRGAGYYPLPGFLGEVASNLDKRHSAFLAFKLRKK